MKTIYLAMWIIHASLIAYHFDCVFGDLSLTIIAIFDIVIPSIILIARIAWLHTKIKDTDEKDFIL